MARPSRAEDDAGTVAIYFAGWRVQVAPAVEIEKGNPPAGAEPVDKGNIRLRDGKTIVEEGGYAIGFAGDAEPKVVRTDPKKPDDDHVAHLVTRLPRR